MAYEQEKTVEQGKTVRRDRRLNKRWVLILVTGLALVFALILRYCVPEPKVKRYFIEDQVIVSGLAEDVDAVIDSVRQTLEDGTLELKERLVLDFLSELPGPCEGLPSAGIAGVQFVIDRYQIKGDVALKQVIQEIQQQSDGRVAPEPNYLTGRPPVDVKGDPWTVGGDPWTVGGDPWTVGGDPWTVGGDASGTTVMISATQAFREQWAFGGAGINLNTGSGVESSGQGVRIGIFDTSPFPVTVASAVFSTTPPLNLTLVHPRPGGRLYPEADAPDVRDHGLFAVGLAHAVAPESEIHLIRVLDNTGQGDLQTLNTALNTFISETVRDRDDLQGAVINLSLGVHPPEDAEEQGLPDEIVSLNTILAAARCFGVVTVAATGNDSAESEPPLPMQVPAAWESALGVAASNIDRELACFSNDGQVAAPGGDGKQPGCKQALHECTGDCSYGLISFSLASGTGYAYWNGTSFSAPLVSGLAALILEAGGGWVPPDVVFDRIKDSATPEGVVDVQSSVP